jgi:RES domain-containing protein
VYLADSLALAALEMFVHIGAAHRSMQWVAVAVDIPDDLRVDALNAPLPTNWRDEPPSSETRDLGTAWLSSLRAPLLKLPSAIVPVEHNLMLNPLHPDARRLAIHEPTPFTFDSRMWK